MLGRTPTDQRSTTRTGPGSGRFDHRADPRSRGDQHVDDVGVAEGGSQSQCGVWWRICELDVGPSVEQRSYDICVAVAGGTDEGTAVLGLVVFVSARVDQNSG